MLWRRLRLSQALRQPQEAWIQADSGGHRVLFDATVGESAFYGHLPPAIAWVLIGGALSPYRKNRCLVFFCDQPAGFCECT